MHLLDKIKAPRDLKKIPRDKLPELALEIREEILGVISAHGGHLGAGLGAVELAISLHYCFDTPKDRLVWDTGHQGYPHKLLTGRKDRFSTLRRYGGISGFLSRVESEYDSFGAGHAGTSISAALGMVEAREQQEEKHHVVAIIGDGSMTAGMAYEGLNHAGALKRDFIVVLNDNEMSISKNVGAFSAYLNRIITDPLYTKVKNETLTFLKNIPKIGQPMATVAKRAEESVKGLVTPGLIFEELGFRYFGPIDGHRLDHLLPTFDNIKQLNGPILVHVLTKKGKGYSPAENDPTSFHGTPSFDLSTGQVKKKKAGPPSYTAIFSKSLIQLAKENKKIVAITAAMPEGTGLSQFSQEFPNRFYDVGISEQHAVTMAAGMAADGLRPVVAIYSTFLQRAFDQIVHDVALQKLPVVFCLDRAGIVGEDGPTHTGAYDISYLKSIPNMVLMAPKDENELRNMLATALHHDGPIAIRYPRGPGIGVRLGEKMHAIPIGKGELLLGNLEDQWDVAMVAIGNMVYPALAAAARLREKGLSVGVVNARFTKPLDRSLLVSVATRCKKIITLEEHSLVGGFGESVLTMVEEEKLEGCIPAVDILKIGLPDKFVEHGSSQVLREKIGLDTESIYKKVYCFINDQAGSEAFESEKRDHSSHIAKVIH